MRGYVWRESDGRRRVRKTLVTIFKTLGVGSCSEWICSGRLAGGLLGGKARRVRFQHVVFHETYEIVRAFAERAGRGEGSTLSQAMGPKQGLTTVVVGVCCRAEAGRVGTFY